MSKPLTIKNHKNLETESVIHESNNSNKISAVNPAAEYLYQDERRP